MASLHAPALPLLPDRARRLCRQLRAYGERFHEERHTAELFHHFVFHYPDALSRACRPGHVTASAWVLDREAGAALLTHHHRLNAWFQPGGHVEEGDPSVAAAALREAREESGLATLRLADEEAIFDLDRHWIPARPNEPGHFHYDVRFLVLARGDEPLVVSSESRALAWAQLERMGEYSQSESVLRLRRKTPGWPEPAC